MSIVNTTAALFGGITFGIAFSVYTSLVIARHLNIIMLESIASSPFEDTTVDVGAILRFRLKFSLIILSLYFWCLSYIVLCLHSRYEPCEGVIY